MALLQTDRLDLRPLHPGDLGAAMKIYKDPVVQEHIASLPNSPEQAWQRILMQIGHWTEFDFGLFGVFERQSGKLIGEAGIAKFRRDLGADFVDTHEAAWLFRHEYHGLGFAMEAMEVIIEWAEQQFRPVRSVALIAEANEPSLRLAQKLGYKRYGICAYKGMHMHKLEKCHRRAGVR